MKERKDQKIGVIVSRIDYGAAELLETRLALELKELGYKVVLIPQYSLNKFQDTEKQNQLNKKIEIIRFCFDQPFQFVASLLKLRRQKIDIIISHNRGGDLLGRLISFGTKTNEIKALHEYYSREILQSRINKIWKKVIRNAAFSYHITDFALTQNQETFQLEQTKTAVVKNAIDFKPISEKFDHAKYGLPEGKKIVLTVARIVQNKGYHNNLDVIIPLLREREDVIYVFVGDNTTEPAVYHSIESRLEKENLKDKIFYLGKIKNVLGLMKEAHLLLHCANHEGFGLIFLEALYAQLPIIATKVGGIPSVLNSTEFELFEINEMDAARKRCEEFLNAEKEKIFRGDYIEYLELFTHKKRAETIDQIIQKIM